MSIKTRFAPSPTGRLHVGNIRTALINWLAARQAGGQMLLRLDDTDSERSREEFTVSIKQDLHWLGLEWDDYQVQSERLERYDEAAEKLRHLGRLYPCYETEEELALKRKTQLARGLPPRYDRAALALSVEERQALEARGVKPHWRFKLEDRFVEWQDRVRGPTRIDCASLSDPVLLRADGRPLYTLTSVVDDAAFAITDVIRGEDHVTNTGVQVQIFEALGAAVPRMAHLPLIADAEGEGLSKRIGSLGVSALREQGIEPLTIAILLSRLGTGEPVEPVESLEALARDFDIERFARATPRFDPSDLERLNAKLLHSWPYERAHAGLAAHGLGHAPAEFWHAIRGNIHHMGEAVSWWRIVYERLPTPADEPDFLAEAAEILPAGPWDDKTWAGWIGAVKTRTGRQGRALFHPIRRALTGRDDGPELARLLPLIGYERARARLLNLG